MKFNYFKNPLCRTTLTSLNILSVCPKSMIFQIHPIFSTKNFTQPKSEVRLFKFHHRQSAYFSTYNALFQTKLTDLDYPVTNPDPDQLKSIVKHEVEGFMEETKEEVERELNQAKKDNNDSNFLDDIEEFEPREVVKDKFSKVLKLPQMRKKWDKLKQGPKPVKIEIDELELQEKFIKGSGNGGQKINKTNSRVELIHMPTGIVVQCQETRSQLLNRKIARKLLKLKLDSHINGALSKISVKADKIRKQQQKKRQKSKKKYQALKEQALQKQETEETDANVI